MSRRLGNRRLRHVPQRCQRADGSYKAAYRSAAKARQEIRAHRGKRPPLYVYECARCGLWHITSQPPQNGR